MNRGQLQDAFAIAESELELGFDGLEIFDGFALADFKPVNVTLTQVARLIRWQCLQINGKWDNEALNEIIELGRRRFNIIGRGN